MRYVHAWRRFSITPILKGDRVSIRWHTRAPLARSLTDYYSNGDTSAVAKLCGTLGAV